MGHQKKNLQLISLDCNLVETGIYNVNTSTKSSISISGPGANAVLEVSNEFVGAKAGVQLYGAKSEGTIRLFNSDYGFNASISGTIGPGISAGVSLKEGFNLELGASAIWGGGISLGIVKY